jgi:hypothetical protein
MAAAPRSNPSLLEQTVAQLRELARSLGVRSYTRLAKAELLDVLAQTETLPAGPSSPTATATPQAPITTQVTFLPRDPQWAYVFWSISAADRARAAAAGGQQLCLRVADVTGLPLGASHPHALQELVVPADATEWYLPVPLSDRDYRVELGYRLGAAGWLPLAVSSVARVPADGPSPVVADAFVPFSLEGPIGPVSQPLGGGGGGVEHERLYQLATAAGARSRRVGSEVLHEHDFNNDQGGLLHASGVGLWASGRNESGSGVQRQRSFWLVADAKLIVYGATDPSASLFIGEQQIPLESDGTFRVQVPFRDGEQVYPIRAVAADGEQERSIRMEFQRSTPDARVNSREEAQLAWF